MIRSLLLLLVVGLFALFAVGVVFSILGPLLLLALKVAVVLLAGYFVLKLVRPDLAEECRRKIEGNGV